MSDRINQRDIDGALRGLNLTAGLEPHEADGTAYPLRAVDSTGSLGLFEQINEQGGVRRLAAGYAAKTKREACMMIAAYREGIEAARS